VAVQRIERGAEFRENQGICGSHAGYLPQNRRVPNGSYTADGRLSWTRKPLNGLVSAVCSGRHPFLDEWC
jgi:hypothetical protein